MTRTFPRTAKQLLQRTREQVLVVLAGVFLLYVALLALTGLQPAEPPLRRAEWVGGLISSVILLLAGWKIFRRTLVNAVVGAILVLVHLDVVRLTLELNLSPTVPILWIVLTTLTTFITVGSRLGAGLTALLVAGLGGLLALSPPTAPHLMTWLTGLVVQLGLSVMGYLVMRFIEVNVTLHAQADDQLRAARQDALTGVLGRAATESELQRLIGHAQRTSTPLSILVTDIDLFKQVNDQHGHNAGDDVLRSFAKRLRRNVKGQGGLVGRWGGEEFLVILPGLARPDALVLAERVREAVQQTPIAGVPITASFGLASLRGPGDDLEALFARADEKLYKAKHGGRNQVR